MAEKNQFASSDVEQIDYESLGKWLKRVRKEKGITQDEACKTFCVSRSVYSKYESGTVRPRREDVDKFAEKYGADVREAQRKMSVIIPDTCALQKNKRLLTLLLSDYDQVVIATSVKEELSSIKNNTKDKRGYERRAAWQNLMNIDSYLDRYPHRVVTAETRDYKIPGGKEGKSSREINDYRLIELAKDLRKKTIGSVFIITDDIDISSFYDDTILLREYVAEVANRAGKVDFGVLEGLNDEFSCVETFSAYLKALSPGIIDTYLADGNTLLINCIQRGGQEKKRAKGKAVDGVPVALNQVHKKLRFLLDHGANPNRNDNGMHCLSPLAHCVQANDIEAFDILLEYGADCNKTSQDETTVDYMKSGKLNEGNSPLMVACWECKPSFVKKLCDTPGICLNQQDSNGYTALIKCAVRRRDAIENSRISEPQRQWLLKTHNELYHLLLDQGADPLIRDRKNRTAADWWAEGDALLQSEQ